MLTSMFCLHCPLHTFNVLHHSGQVWGWGEEKACCKIIRSWKQPVKKCIGRRSPTSATPPQNREIRDWLICNNFWKLYLTTKEAFFRGAFTLLNYCVASWRWGHCDRSGQILPLLKAWFQGILINWAKRAFIAAVNIHSSMKAWGKFYLRFRKGRFINICFLYLFSLFFWWWWCLK